MASVWFPVAENVRHIEPLLTDPDDLAQLARLHAWLSVAHQRLSSTFTRRVEQGFIRACHGDLHSGNIALIDSQPVPFDCIEFNDSLRFIDTASDIAFLTMDLLYHQRPELANRLLNRYLEYSGDYKLVSLLRFYQVYRAMVRAKVSILRTQQLAGVDAASGDARAMREDYRHHIKLATSLTEASRPCLMIMHGLSGSGKSTIARQISAHSGAIHLRSDVERKRIFGLKPRQSSAAIVGGIYTESASAKTFERLLQLAKQLLQAGMPVIVDATFLHQFARQPFQALAHRCGVPFAIVSCQAREEELEQRLRLRAVRGDDASEASAEVMRQQQQVVEPFTGAEQACVITLSPDLMAPAAERELPPAISTFLAGVPEQEAANYHAELPVRHPGA